MPNRAFTCSATSQGHMDDKTHTFTSPSIFGLLDSHGLGWAIYGYEAQPLSRAAFTDINAAAVSSRQFPAGVSPAPATAGPAPVTDAALTSYIRAHA